MAWPPGRAVLLNKAGMMKRLIRLFVLMLVAGAMLAGCNTARGMGEDIQHLGNAISHAAS